jgi:hypothetical protein
MRGFILLLTTFTTAMLGALLQTRPAEAGQAGPFPQLYGRPTLFCPPGNYAEGLTARIAADERLAILQQTLLDTNNNNNTTTDDPNNNATQAEQQPEEEEEAALRVRCVPCAANTYSDGSDAWGLEACHPCPEGTVAPLAGATACV